MYWLRALSELLSSLLCVCLQVLLVPGGVFNINSSDPCPYVRAAFSLSTPQQIDEVQHARTHILCGYNFYPGCYTKNTRAETTKNQ